MHRKQTAADDILVVLGRKQPSGTSDLWSHVASDLGIKSTESLVQEEIMNNDSTKVESTRADI